MKSTQMILWLVLLVVFLLGWAAFPTGSSLAAQLTTETPLPDPLTPHELIQLINRVRTGRGLPALIVDPILMGTAQTTADTMASVNMVGHIGDVRGRVMAAGYGAGDIPWATENYVVLPLGPDHPQIILQAWADDLHMRPMAHPDYRHVGAGVSRTVDGAVYYIIHAGYTSNRTYKPASTPGPGTPTAAAVSQIIFAVQTAAPASDGTLTHVVLSGQSLWSIAIAYGTHILDIQQLNGLPADYMTIYAGQKLKIPTRVGPSLPSPTSTSTTPARVAGASVTRTAVEADASPTPKPGGSPAPTADAAAEIIGNTLVILALVGVALVAFGVLFRAK